VWRVVSDVPSHVRWMADAESIRVTGPGRFECETRVGPLRTLDRMEIVEWRPGRVLGVRHSGLVTGTGRFALSWAGPGRTRFTWSESLDLPWYFAPPVARLALRAVWKGNIRRLKRLIESGAL
jgi:Polyketide cyclase / dehydrase and lipid transport